MLRLSTPSSAKGMTIVELLVASSIASVLLAVAATTFLTQRELVGHDLKRTAVNQNLRSAIDILGMNIRLAGENLSGTFPAIELTDGSSGAPDELILRRNLLDEVLKICTPITNATTDPLYFAIGGTTPGCIHSDQAQSFSSWTTYLSSQGGTALAYAYDPASQLGEFFWFSAITDTGSDMFVQPDDSWTQSYGVGQAAAYIIEQWHFRLDGENIQLIVDGNIANPQNVIFGVSDFQATITKSDGSTMTSFGVSDDWTEIQSINITLTANDTSSLQAIDRTLNASFFPRNVLSN
ncbi:MAG: prepilin-type N-terminal cleavage/methylation domain-containing protein [Bdellovibrionales bacterium]|nr:prepilin-type N-terminal cleavage/methylation domain-containing protein [Bdellovibrionales bacterium]